jgi:hypothetical protein
MALRNYKVGESIEIVYQAPNKASGLLNVVSEIYLPGDPPQKNPVYFPDIVLVEIGTTGTYRGEFEPNAQGEWKVITHKADGDGQVISKYSVGAYDVHTVGEAVGTVDTKASGIKSKTDNLPGDPASESGVRGPDNDTLKTISDQIDAVDAKVGALDTPPMVA